MKHGERGEWQEMKLGNLDQWGLGGHGKSLDFYFDSMEGH